MPERVLLNQTQEEYEEDKISVTSSQSEAYDPDEEFLVERILAEKKKDDGKMQYLISWANYPEDKSTWEPKKNIQDPEILSAWKDRKEQEAKGLESPFDFARFDYRMKQLLQEKEQRCRHRKAKRKQLGIPVSPDPEVRRSRDDDSDSTEAVESDHVPRDSSPETKQKSHKPQKTKKLSKPCVRDSYESEVSDDAVASDDSLIEELLHKNKEKSQKAALRAIRHKRFAPQSKKSGDQNKSFPKESSKKSKSTKDSSSSPSSDVLLEDVSDQRRQAQERSESTDTAISKQFTSTIQGSPKPPATSISLGAAALGFRGRLAVRGVSAVGRGRGATRGGSSLGPKNVFSSRPPVKRRPTLIENSTNSSKDRKHYTNMHIRRKAELASRELAERAPDVAALGGLFAASNPSTFHALQPAYRKVPNKASNQEDSNASSAMDVDDLFVGQRYPEGSTNPWAPTRSVEPISNPPADNQQPPRPEYHREQHRFNAICHFWRLKGSCGSGYLCDFKHTDEVHIPFGPPPPDHICNCRRLDVDQPSNLPTYDPQSSRPQYQPHHGFDAICHFWHGNGDCNKGSDCRYVHADDGQLPISLVPPRHSSHRPRDGSPANDFYRPLPTLAKYDDSLAPPPLSTSSGKQKDSLQPDSLPRRPLFNSRDPAICPFWLHGNDCNRGSKCKFLHTDDLRFAVASRPNYKDETCKFWAQGYCSKTSKQCAYLHGYPNGMPEETEVPEHGQQPEPSVPSPIIGDVAAILTGARKSVSFAGGEPMVFSDETGGYSLHETRPAQKPENSSLARKPRFGQPCPFWRAGDCWHGDKCLYWHTYDGSDKLYEQTAEIPTVSALNWKEVVSNVTQKTVEQARTIGTTHFRSDTGSTQGIHHAHPPQIQTASKSMSFQTAEEDVGREASVESRDVPDQAGTTTGSNNIQLDAVNIPSADQGRPEVVPPKSKRPGLTISLDSYRRKKAIKDLGDRGKEVIFGKDESKSIVADFGDLTLTNQHPWAQSFAGVSKLHFRKICLAQDFKAQLGSLQHQKLWQGSLGSSATDDEGLKTMDKAWEQLRLNSAGFLAVCPDFVVLVFPAIEEWKFIEGSANFLPEMRLRYLIFQANLDLNTPPDTGIPTHPTKYRNTLVESIHGLNFQSLLPKGKPKHGYHFYLLFPPTANLTAGFITNWLQQSYNHCNIYSSQTEGAWDSFVKDPKVGLGIVLIHESVVASVCELPSLRRLVTDTPNKSTVFWYIAEGAAEYPMYGPPEGSSFGQITATRLLPQGHAFFLTPSFLIAEPGRAYALLDWFEKVLLKKAPGSWKLVCAYNIRKYLLDLAIEKSAERDELEAEYQGQARKDAIMEEKGLSYANCLLRFQVHDAVVKMLSRSGTNYYSDDDSSDIADEFTSPIIYADKFVNADDEQALVTWFAGWAMCKLDQFRKFTVVGTAPKSEKRAVRVKTVTSGPESPNLRERARSNPSEISMFKSDASSKPGIPKTGKIFRDLLPISPVESSNIGSAPPKVSESRPAPEGPASVELQRGISVVATLKPSASSSVSPAQALENSSSEFGIKGLASKLPVTFGPPISPQFPLAGHKVTVPSNSPVGGYAITAPNETSPASPPQDQDIEMSIENVSVSGHDPAAQRQGNAGPTSLDGAFIFSPPQFDGPGNKRPASSSSSRSSIQSDESGRPFVPKSFRSSGTIRPELAVKTGYISSEDQETYDAPHRRALGDVSNNSSSEFSHQGSHHIPVEGATQQDSDMMELDSPVLGESASTSAGEMEKGEILTKEIKYEATTTWYEKWYKKGKGWEHVYVESWEKAWKYLGVKEDVTGGQ